MSDNLIQALTNPLKAKLLLEIYARKQATAKLLAEKFTDIPLPTIYRHLKRLHDDGLIRIVKKRPVRGAVEKVYAPIPDLMANTQKQLENNDGATYLLLFHQFMLGITHEFQEYASRQDIDIIGDGSGFSLAPVYVTTDELGELLQKIGALLLPLYSQEPSTERSLHNICIITTPPQEPPREPQQPPPEPSDPPPHEHPHDPPHQ